jgi:hypothetical protein
MDKHARITSGYWAQKQQLNATRAIFHQWEMLESTRCIDNFRITAGMKEGFREGFFFSDSDAYKWLDAASRILAFNPDPKLTYLVEGFISILEKAQDEDGYLYTYNQIHFGNSRWQSLQIEHEFYCMGHLIEAGISNLQATGKDSLFNIARKAADLLVERFWEAPPEYTDGHEEVEIALIKLSRQTGLSRYRDLAKRFLERRGRISAYPAHFIWDTLWSAGKMRTVAALRKQYYQRHPEERFHLPAHNKHLIPRGMPLRLIGQTLSGKYCQQHQPLQDQEVPVGHAVRFAYLNTAAAMLASDEGDDSDLPRMVRLWQHMVDRRMSVSGGIGSLPLTEGFGRDFEMDPKVVYNETCAALGCMMWNHEMALATGSPEFDDLFEWQLYNAASVGIGQDGCSYFYNNPLTTKGGYLRESWYDIPCCPSNLSRIWASLADYTVTRRKDEIIIHQYFGCEIDLDPAEKNKIRINSQLPMDGMIDIHFEMETPNRFLVKMRKPIWAQKYSIHLNGKPISVAEVQSDYQGESACGLDFTASSWLILEGEFSSGDILELNFDMPIRLLRQDKRIPKCGGLVAVSRGPVLFCREAIDNPGDFEGQILDLSTLVVDFNAQVSDFPILRGSTPSGEVVKFTPYFYWGNRGETAMSVFIRDQL